MASSEPPPAPALSPLPTLGGVGGKGQNLKFILGLKLSQLRREKKYPLKRLASLSGLSVSYLNEIEKGKKYPKPEKIFALAEALGVKYEDLVSLDLGANMTSLEKMLKTGALQNFPFEIFGVNSSGLMEMMSGAPDRFSALIDTIQKIIRRYDMRVEHLLLTAMRSYLEMNNNYFPDLEKAAEKFRKEHKWLRGTGAHRADVVTRLEQFLVREHGYEIDEVTLGKEADLHSQRSIFVAGAKNRLLLNPALEPMQRAFVLAREIGYRYLGLEARMATASPDESATFDQHLNHQRASYFAGALLLDQALICDAIGPFLAKKKWEPDALRELPVRFGATPEMFFHRLSQLLPRFFGLGQMYFLRFEHYTDTGRFRPAKELHFTRMHSTHSIGVNEHYCRRWVTMRLLEELSRQRKGAGGESPVLVGAQRSKFPGTDNEYFSLSMATASGLREGVNACVTLGFAMTDTFREKVRFWADPSIPDKMVGDTCERCAITNCEVRASEPRILQRDQERARQSQALRDLIERVRK